MKRKITHITLLLLSFLSKGYTQSDSITEVVFDNLKYVIDIEKKANNNFCIYGHHSLDGDVGQPTTFVGEFDEFFEPIFIKSSQDSERSLFNTYSYYDSINQIVINSASARGYSGNTSTEGAYQYIDNQGNTKWFKTFQPLNSQGGQSGSVIQIPGKIGYWGFSYFVDDNVGSAYGDFHLVNFNSEGELLTSKRIAGGHQLNETGWSLTSTPDSGIVFTGESMKVYNRSFDSDSINLIVTKLDKNLNVLWSKQFDFGGQEKYGSYVNASCSTLKNGDIILHTTHTYNDLTNLEILVIKLDKNGNFIWGKRIGKKNLRDNLISKPPLLLGDSLILVTSSTSNSGLNISLLDTAGTLLKNYHTTNTSDQFSYNPKIIGNNVYFMGATKMYNTFDRWQGRILKFPLRFLFKDFDKLKNCDITWSENFFDLDESIAPTLIDDYPMTYTDINFSFDATYTENDITTNTFNKCKIKNDFYKISATTTLICNTEESVTLTYPSNQSLQWKKKESNTVESTSPEPTFSPQETTTYEVYENGVLADEITIFVSNPSLCFPVTIQGSRVVCKEKEFVLSSQKEQLLTWIKVENNMVDTLGTGDSITVSIQDTAIVIGINEQGGLDTKILIPEICLEEIIRIEGTDKFCLGDSIKLWVTGEGNNFTWFPTGNETEIIATGNPIFISTSQIPQLSISVKNEFGSSGLHTFSILDEIECKTGIIDASSYNFCPGEEIELTFHGEIPENASSYWSSFRNNNEVLGYSRNLTITPKVSDAYLFFIDGFNRNPAAVSIKKRDNCSQVTIENNEDRFFCLGDSLYFSANGDIGYLWYDLSSPTTILSTNDNLWFKPTTNTTIQVKGNQGTRDNINLIQKTGESCLTICNYITPNNDDKNDFFEIKYAQNKSVFEVYIFNRWNQLVYENKDYQNDWGGENLPKATYFYIIKIKDNKGLELKGKLFIDHD